MRSTGGVRCSEGFVAVLNRRSLEASRVAIAALGLVISSCASVQPVKVSPSTACPGDPITVSWIATGETAMATVPVKVAPGDSSAQATDFCVQALASGAKLNKVSSRGTMSLRASGDTEFLVLAQGWFGKPAHNCGRLFMNEVLPLSDVPQCISEAPGTVERAVQVHLVRRGDSKWSSTATTGVVENDNPVAVTIRHAGRSIVLPARSITDLFTGTDPNADWWVEYTWGTGPYCGKAGAPVPNSLSLKVHPLCPTTGSATH